MADAVRQGLARRASPAPRASGKTEALRRLAGALAGREGLEVLVVLAGVRPEEIAEWRAVAPGAALTLRRARADAQAQAVEQAVEQGRRVAARGGDAVVLIDALEYLPGRRPPAARSPRRRNIADGGSLTVDRDRAGAARRRDDGHRARRAR